MSNWHDGDETDETDELDGGDGEGQWELDPTDPSHPDFDLSEASPYSDYQHRRGLLPPPRWLIVLVSIIVLLALFSPFCARILP